MLLSEYEWPDINGLDLVFPAIGAPDILLREAKEREGAGDADIKRGVKMFNKLFFSGGKVTPKKEFKDLMFAGSGHWSEKAFLWCRAFMGSFEPKHEHKEIICGMILGELVERVEAGDS